MSIVIAGGIYWVNSPSKEEIRHYRQSYCDDNCGSDWEIGQELWLASYNKGLVKLSPTGGNIIIGSMFCSVILILVVSGLSDKKETTKKD